jgi:hypothetical protein
MDQVGVHRPEPIAALPRDTMPAHDLLGARHEELRRTMISSPLFFVVLRVLRAFVVFL